MYLHNFLFRDRLYPRLLKYLINFTVIFLSVYNFIEFHNVFYSEKCNLYLFIINIFKRLNVNRVGNNNLKNHR